MSPARLWFALGLGAAAPLGCLPADTRDPPGKLTMAVSPSDATVHQFGSADGWTIAFERVLVSLGHTSLDSDCDSYSEARYYRLLDLGAGSGQTLGRLFGLGTCDVQFRFAPADSDAVLGAGVTPADEMYMRTPVPDDGFNHDAGVALDVTGSASRDGAVTLFHWSFRQNIRYGNCAVSENGQLLGGVTLHGGDDLTYDLRIESEALFRDSVDPDQAAIRFAPFAAADLVFGNADGQVSLDELGRVPGWLAASDRSGRDVTWRPAMPLGATTDDAGAATGADAGAAGDASSGPLVSATLADFVYVFLVPTLPRFRDVGRCSTFPPQQVVPLPAARPPPPG